MNDVEKVKQICKERKIAISKLEKDLGFANGYIGQLKKGYFPSDRAKKISSYLGIDLNGTEGENIIYNSEDIARDESERRLLLLCRKAGNANPEEKEAIINSFENSIDLFLKAKGIIKGE